ncbi:MAG: hypothetical protein ACREEQ_04860, partial [Caulobacteraceae bacterium]
MAESLGEVAPGPRPYLEGRQALAARVAGVRGPCFWPALPGKSALSALERASLVRLAEVSNGDWEAEAMVAAMEAMRHAPAGDVVEIGVVGARSAAVLAWLARRHQVGKTLCVGAWSEAALTAFQIDLLALAEGGLNYLSNSPEGAATLYRPGLCVSTAAFGDVAYEGRIALLHVGEGADAAGWTERVAAGGWIVFD